MTYELKLAGFRLVNDTAECVTALCAMMQRAVDAANLGKRQHNEEDHDNGLAVELALAGDDPYGVRVGYIMPEPPVALEQFLHAVEASLMPPMRIHWVALVRIVQQPEEVPS